MSASSSRSDVASSWLVAEEWRGFRPSQSQRMYPSLNTGRGTWLEGCMERNGGVVVGIEGGNNLRCIACE